MNIKAIINRSPLILINSLIIAIELLFGSSFNEKTIIEDIAPKSKPWINLKTKNLPLDKGKLLQTENIWKWTHNPPNPIENPVKKPHNNVFLKETHLKAPVQNSKKIFKIEEISARDSIGNRVEIVVIITEKKIIKEHIVIITCALELIASVKAFI